MKSQNIYLLLAFLLLLPVSCGNAENNDVTLTVGGELKYLNNVSLDYENIFFDDFSGGVDSNSWYIANQAWGESNGGVIPQNVSYTDDGILVLTGNGGYYLDNKVKGVGDVTDGRYTGAALISKFTVKPGRYEIKMKALPRLGACTAFWTFAYDHGALDNNHEIDIELPGGNQTGVPTFENVLNTNYIAETSSISQDTKISNLINETETFLNDGRWHTFGFDWYTNPEKIVYYIDNKISAISDVFVPSKSGRLWVGNWFPVTSGFVGTAEFETDQMLVDYIKYTPFKDQPYIEFNPDVNGVASTNLYPSNAITLKTINKVANGDFEFNSEQVEISGWNFTKYRWEEQEVNDVVRIEDYSGLSSSKALYVKDGGLAIQDVTAVYSNFAHDLKVNAKGKGNIYVEYYSTVTTSVLKQYSIEIDSEEYKEYALELLAPANTQKLSIVVETTQGNEMYVDDIELFAK